MPAKFVNIDRNTPPPLPPALSDQVGDCHMAPFIMDAVPARAKARFVAGQAGSSPSRF